VKNISPIKIALLIFLLVAQGTLFADQHDASNTEEQAEAQSNQPQPTTTQENQTSADSFVPTETISEDLSVPFPVDI
jgi:hypothetical protein